MQQTVLEGVDYRPLINLMGVWKGSEGVDVAPEPDADETNPYYETLIFEASGDVTNAGEQTLAVVRYDEVISRKSDDGVFHDQVGYWLWDAASGTLCETLTIPRAVTLLAGGRARIDGDKTLLAVKAVDGSDTWGIVQSPFMREKARTTEFRHQPAVVGDTLNYSETTVLEIYGKSAYQHTDGNTLQRV